MEELLCLWTYLDWKLPMSCNSIPATHREAREHEAIWSRKNFFSKLNVINDAEPPLQL